MFGIGKSKVKTVKQPEKAPANPTKVVVNTKPAEPPKPVQPKDLEFFSRPRSITRDTAKEDPELLAALIEFRKAYCAVYRAFIHEHCDTENELWSQIDDMMFKGSYNFHCGVGDLEYLFLYNARDNEEIKDCLGFTYKPIYQNGYYYDHEAEMIEYFENVIEPESIRLGINLEEDAKDDIEVRDRIATRWSAVNKCGKLFCTPFLSPENFMKFVNRMHAEILCGTFPVLRRNPDINSKGGLELIMDTGYSVPSLANSVSQLVKCATPDYSQKILFTWEKKDFVLDRYFGSDILTCEKNPLDEGYPVSPARRIKFIGLDWQKNPIPWTEKYVNPDTFRKDCYTLAKEAVIQDCVYSKRLNAVIIDEPGKEGELLRPFKNKKYVDISKDPFLMEEKQSRKEIENNNNDIDLD